MEILAILSAAIISNKEKQILKCQKYQEILVIFNDLTHENVNENLKIFNEKKF